MTEVKIFAMYSQLLCEFTANFEDIYSLYSLAYSPMCESSINSKIAESTHLKRHVITPGKSVGE